MTRELPSGLDVAHLSPKKRALLIARLEGGAVGPDEGRPRYGPDTLIVNAEARHEPYPANAFQAEKLAHLDEASGGTCRLFMETARAGLDAERFCAAWRTLHGHYDVMRSRLVARAHQVQPPDTPFEPRFQDLSTLPGADAARLLAAARARMKALGTDAPAVVVEVYRLGTDAYRLFHSFNLLVMDLPSVEFLALRCRRVYEGVFEHEHRPPLHLRDYRVTETAYLESGDGARARNYWDRRIDEAPERLAGRDLAAPQDPGEQPGSCPASPALPGTTSAAGEPAMAGAETSSAYGHVCRVISRDDWARGRRIAGSFGVSELVAVQTLFADGLARAVGRTGLAIEKRVFQRLPFHPDIYELLGPFSIGHVLTHRHDGNTSFLQRVRTAAEQADRDQVHAFYDAASSWYARERRDARRGKIVFTNTCQRFEEFVLNSTVPPLRWFGEFLETVQFLPDTAFEYVLVENDGALENHWFVNHGELPAPFLTSFCRQYIETLQRLCLDPALWEASCVFAGARGETAP